MNTINDMAQLIMACDFDHRHYMEFPQENYPKQILLFKDNSPVNSKISVVLTYSTELNKFIQINAMLTSEWIAESMVIRSEKDIEKCIRLLDVLDYKHSFTRTITTTITKLIKQDNIEEARKRLSWIVGRDTEELDESEITRATVETIAENTVDGIIAPLFFFIIGGPMGAILYRTANTMDSMLGYKNQKYMYFGRVAARFDDVLNWIPA